MNIQKLSAIAVLAAFTTPALAADMPAPDAGKTANEKCYGVAKAGKNDCATAGHNSCAGSSKADADKTAWIFVPAGLCEKLAGGSLEMPK